MESVVICIISSESKATSIVNDLKRAGFPEGDISALFPDKSGTRDFAHEQNTKMPEGAATGATAGGVVGGIVGVLAGIGALAIPGVGPLIAAGPILAALSGAAIGATVGGITGALVGLGMTEIEAKVYEGKVKDGNILLSVHTRDAAATKQAQAVFEKGGAEHIRVTSTSSLTAAERANQAPV